jgi:acyl-CoA thioester hydrolase
MTAIKDTSPSCPEREFPKGVLRLTRQTVLPEWIDYNGHMNLAYYIVAIDQAFDELLENWLGIGETFVARSRLGPMSLQAQTFYVEEMLEGQPFFVDVRLVDFDAKRFHFYAEIIIEADEENGERLSAAYEALSMCVDLDSRRSTPYPEWTQARMQAMIDAQAHLPRPERLGKTIGIRRK